MTTVFCGRSRRGSSFCRSAAGFCVRSVELPEAYPKDPADRLIAGTALVEGLSLVTADREIRRSQVVRTIW
jgi:PIN domain nuclease of toxin-antitoxin system